MNIIQEIGIILLIIIPCVLWYAYIELKYENRNKTRKTWAVGDIVYCDTEDVLKGEVTEVNNKRVVVKLSLRKEQVYQIK
jgi:hypothetical protein